MQRVTCLVDRHAGTERHARFASEAFQHARRRGASATQDENELVTAPTHHGVVATHKRHEARRDDDKLFVTRFVPITVVDLLESVDVDNGNCVARSHTRQGGLAGLAQRQTGQLIGGVIIVETVFSLPGLGKTVIDAINRQDLPVIIGIVLFVISLFSRLVKSNERIASAMEALASKLHREDK